MSGGDQQVTHQIMRLENTVGKATRQTMPITVRRQIQMVLGLPGKEEGVERASIRGSSVTLRVVERVILEPSICKFYSDANTCQKGGRLTYHRYRHQLNHNSKQTYHCNFPNCTRTFVRGDLLKRHMDRHAAKGSQLNQRDAMAGNATPIMTTGPSSPDFNRNPMDYPKARPSLQYQHSQDSSANPFSPVVNTGQGMFPNGNMPGGMDGYMSQAQNYGNPVTQQTPQHSPIVAQRPSMPGMGPFGVMSPMSNQQGFQNPANTQQANSFVPQQNVLPMNLPPSQFSAAQNAMPRDGQFTGGNMQTDYADSGGNAQASELMMLDQMAMPGTVPVFGGDGDINKSPYVGMPEDFMAYLFNSPNALADNIMTRYLSRIL